MSALSGAVIFLDRDGVLNDIVIDEEHGTIDSPMNPEQMKISPGVTQALQVLAQKGFRFLIVTNQPAAAKRKTTLQNLHLAHEKLVQELTGQGLEILQSYICFHRKEDRCECRKPGVGSFKQALNDHPWIQISESWMVGDGVTDIQAGQKMGLKTAFLGPKKCDACKILQGAPPDFWGENLLAFAQSITKIEAHS